MIGRLKNVAGVLKIQPAMQCMDTVSCNLILGGKIWYYS